MFPLNPRGRSADTNTPNRFERIHIEPDPAALLEEDVTDCVETTYLRAASKSILTTNDSPDLGFRYSVNPYYGCTHGCAYCYARPYHEYWGMSAGLDFESKILVKMDAPRLLRETLVKRSYQPDIICHERCDGLLSAGREAVRAYSAVP